MRAKVPTWPVMAAGWSSASTASTSASTAAPGAETMYEVALAASRRQEYPVARATYMQVTTRHPEFSKVGCSPLFRAAGGGRGGCQTRKFALLLGVMGLDAAPCPYRRAAPLPPRMLWPHIHRKNVTK